MFLGIIRVSSECVSIILFDRTYIACDSISSLCAYRQTYIYTRIYRERYAYAYSPFMRELHDSVHILCMHMRVFIYIVMYIIHISNFSTLPFPDTQALWLTYSPFLPLLQWSWTTKYRQLLIYMMVVVAATAEWKKHPVVWADNCEQREYTRKLATVSFENMHLDYVYSLFSCSLLTHDDMIDALFFICMHKQHDRNYLSILVLVCSRTEAEKKYVAHTPQHNWFSGNY